MTARLKAFATLTALALMLLLLAYLALGAAASSQVEVGLRSVARPQALSAEAWRTLAAALADLDQSWDPAAQSFSAWNAAHSHPGLHWESLSGRLNLNTISPFVLGQPGLVETLAGLTLEDFVKRRAERGPASEAGAYTGAIQAWALGRWFTTHSLWNLNTADEVMAEAMVSQRTGSPAVGAAVRATLRSFRQRQALLTPTDWQASAGAEQSTLDPVVTLDPELDVNEVPEDLLAVLLATPAWHVLQPRETARVLVEGRASAPWTPERLKATLALPPQNPLWSYLGTRTRFLGGTVTVGGRLDFVVFLAGAPGARPSPRVIRTQWSAP